MKSDYIVDIVDRKVYSSLLGKHHYLTSISKSFRSGYDYGLLKDVGFLRQCVGVCIFTSLPVPEIAVGAFGLQRDDQDGLFELSRLCIHPEIQEDEHCIASWFVSRAIKALRKTTRVRAILSYADSEFHKGTVYSALGFTYHGLTSAKSDFLPDGATKVTSRGTGGLDGKWVPRSRKHRYMRVFDNTVKCKWGVVSEAAQDGEGS